MSSARRQRVVCTTQHVVCTMSACRLHDVSMSSARRQHVVCTVPVFISFDSNNLETHSKLCSHKHPQTHTHVVYSQTHTPYHTHTLHHYIVIISIYTQVVNKLSYMLTQQLLTGLQIIVNAGLLMKQQILRYFKRFSLHCYDDTHVRTHDENIHV